MIPKAVLLSVLLATASTASPTPQHVGEKRSIVKRWEDGVDCTSDTVASAGKAGLFFAVDSDGQTINCDDVADVSADQ